jgi:hypothetical protein
MINRNSLLASIEALANAERITKAKLAELSRDMLTYLVVDDTNDIDICNRLISVLSPVNKRVAILYFAHFLPFKQEKDGEGKQARFVRFGSKMKGDKKLANKLQSVVDFLADESNTIWTWQADHLDIDKVPDYAKSITNAVKKALADSDNGLDQGQIMQAVLDGGVDPGTILVLLEHMAAQQSIQVLEAEQNELVAA